MRGVPVSLKSSVITLLYRLDLTVGMEAIQLENLNALGAIAPGVVGATWLPSTTKGKVSVITIMDSGIQATIRIV